MPDIPNHFIRGCLSGLDITDDSIPMLLEKSGVPLSAFQQEKGAISEQRYISLLKNIMIHLGDEFLGLTEQRCKPGQFAILARMSCHLPTLRAVYEEWANLYNITREDITLGLTAKDGIATISIDLTNKSMDHMYFLSEFCLTSMHHFANWVTGTYIPLQQVFLSYPKPAHYEYYDRLFSCEILFDQPCCGFSFDDSLLNLSPIRSQSEIIEALKATPAVFLQLPPDTDSYCYRTQIIIHNFYKHEQRIPNLEEAAEKLHISQRTLRRKLALEDKKYQEIKDDIRREIALNIIENENTSFEELAEGLGYSEQGAFSRAFKRWTNTTPKKYREIKQGTGHEQ